MDFYESVIRRLLFGMSDDPENPHKLALLALRAAQKSPRLLQAIDRWYAVHDDRLRVSVFGIDFPNPIGLAGGMLKNAEGLHTAAAFGFGSIEAGTTLPEPQPGNPRPRIWRVVDPTDGLTIVNAMGFNSEGAERFRARVKRNGKPSVPLGVNVSRNKVTPNETAHEDYALCLKLLHGTADWFTVNVSSPNTPGLRELQDADNLRILLQTVRRVLDDIAREHGRHIPFLLKIAPDLGDEAVDRACELAELFGCSGIVATNTTLKRTNIEDHPHAAQKGGMSGPHAHARALEVVRRCHTALNGRLPIVGVSGIRDVDGVLRMFEAGATLVQAYTGFIEHGPAFPGTLNEELAIRLMSANLDTMAALQASLRRAP